jgi:hypothetical protein
MDGQEKYRRALGLAFSGLPDIAHLLEALDGTIRGRTQSMESAAAEKKNGDDWPDDVWFIDEGALIDEALGLAFVTGQLFITAVLASCQGLHRFHASPPAEAAPSATSVGGKSHAKDRAASKKSNSKKI